MHATALAAIMALSGPELPPRQCPVAAIERGVTMRQWQAVRAAVAPIFAGDQKSTIALVMAGAKGTEARRAVTPADPPPPIPPIPLPASLWLLLSGMAALAWAKISRRSSAANTPEATGSGASLSPDPGAAAAGAFSEGA